jgi:hypothetical protein
MKQRNEEISSWPAVRPAIDLHVITAINVQFLPSDIVTVGRKECRGAGNFLRRREAT